MSIYKLSIILTVYNKGPFIRRSFDNLLNQENTCDGDFEVLVVNDGSTDNSAMIINEYKQREPWIKVLTQGNQGLSMARNNGANQAQGDYVWFIDADDIISRNAVSSICKAMDTSPDVMPIYAQNDNEDVIRNEIETDVKSGKDILFSNKWQNCGVFYVMKRVFLRANNLCFFPGIYHEDNEFTPRMLYYASSAVVIPEVLYTIYHEPNSITGVPREKRAFDYLTVAEHLIDFAKRNNELKTAVGERLMLKAAIAINNGFDIIVQNSKEAQGKFNTTFYENKHLLQGLDGAPLFKYHLESFLFKLFPKHMVCVYKIMKIIG